ncbi:5701_t:CDS:1, partial [Funneliformis mosseae]
QPSEAFENFWYFWIVYAIKGEQFNRITVRAFEKALTLEENSEALEKCFELIIQSIRYQPLDQEPLESLLTDLKSAWNSYLEFDCWEFETSVKSGTNSKNNSKGTSRRTSRKSSNASKMDGDTFNVGTSTSNRRISENQVDPYREWAAILNNILSDQLFKQKYEEITPEGDKRSAWDTIKKDPKYLSEKHVPSDLEKPHIRYYRMMNKKEKNNPLRDSNPWTNPDDRDLTITEYDNIYQNDQDEEGLDTTWNIEDTTFSPIRNLQERRNIYQDTTDNRREDTDNREEQRGPEGGNDMITQFLQGFGDLLKAHTVAPHS